MNREIKFRAFWRDTLKLEEDFSDEYIIDSCNDDAFIINQFINSKDANGVEVYDGDILKAPSGNLFIVGWNPEKLRWSMWFRGVSFNMNMALLTVVGNIVQNPELLNTPTGTPQP